jgi:4-diphosphocytidyl-2C-methyl-D-erythritol kinase
MTNEDKNQDQEIIRLRDGIKSKVPWAIFVWAIAIIMSGVGWTVFSTAASDSKIESKAENALVRISAVEGNINTINTKLDLLLTYFKLAPKE